MKKPMVSVIIPVYNVEKYLTKCIESVLSQTYENIEILLIDDGSTDKSAAICEMYSEKHENIRVIHKSNGGLSSARNAGIDIATGDYINFLDSDDYILPEMYLEMLEHMLKQESQICICSIKKIDEEGNVIKESQLQEGTYSQKEIFRIMSLDSTYRTACNKMYRKEIFNGLRFPIGYIHEDEFLAHHIFKRCEKVFVCNSPFYIYVRRNNSIMTSQYSTKRLDGAWALFDRYNFFIGEGEKDLAYEALVSSALIVKQSIHKLSVADNREIFEKVVNTIVPKLHWGYTKFSIYIYYYLKKIFRR